MSATDGLVSATVAASATSAAARSRCRWRYRTCCVRRRSRPDSLDR